MTITSLLPAAGAHEVEIVGLDALGFEIMETVVMGGILPVLTTNIYSAINCAYVKSSGSINPLINGASGTITISSAPILTIPPALPAGLPVLLIQIDIGKSVTGTSYFKVPKGKTALVTSIVVASSDKTLDVSVLANVDPISRTVTTGFIEKQRIMADRGTTVLNFSFPIFLPELAEIYMTWADTRGKGIAATIGLELFTE
jgi:hypothetical protein